MDSDTIDGLTFAEFQKAFSEGETNEYLCNFYKAPNETQFSDVLNRINQERDTSRPLYYMGVVGGVDMDLNYIAGLAPERSFLFDISERPIAYLGLRLAMFAGADTIGDYYLNLMGVHEDDREGFWNINSNEEMMKALNAYHLDPKHVFSRTLQAVKALGYDAPLPEHLGDVFFEPEIRRDMAKACLKYIGMMLQDKEAHNSWLVRPNFDVARIKALDGSVKGFNADLFTGFPKAAERLSSAYGMEQLVVYISNVPEIAGRKQRKGTGPVTDPRPVEERLRETFGDWTEQLDKLWLVDSRLNRNRIIGGKGIKLQKPNQ